MPSSFAEKDALDLLADLLGTTRAELVRTIVKASTRDWQRVLRREQRRLRELDQLDDDDD